MLLYVNFIISVADYNCNLDAPTLSDLYTPQRLTS